MELDPRFVDVIVKRWQTFTGKHTTLDGDGRTFDEITSERLVVNSSAPDALKADVIYAE